jgi:uncharacterized YigZ family protein
MESYITIHHHASFEYEDRKSVFIGEAMPVSTEEEALLFIESVKRRFPDARHHVYAYVLRENSIMRFTDDREPQGTAGMPILDIIRKRALTDICVVVVRYFGGILLGTGGLVHAYSEAAAEAIDAAKVIEYNIYKTFSVQISYSDYQKITPIFSVSGVFLENTEYLDSVVITISCVSSLYGNIHDKITEYTSGRAKIEVLEEKFDFKE